MVPSEITNHIIFRFLSEISDGKFRQTTPLDTQRIVWGRKRDTHRFEIWAQAVQSGKAVFGDGKNGWRKCHTDNFWAYYAKETN